MASIEEACNAFGKRPAIAAVVGPRVYDSVLPPETALPALVFTVLAPRELVHSKGIEASRAWFVQWDAYGADGADMRRLVAVRDAELNIWRGPAGGITVNRALRDGLPFKTLEPPLSGGPNQIHRNVSRWAIHVVEPEAVVSL